MIVDAWTILIKDLKLDLRKMENFFSMLFFSLIILLVFAFSLPANKETRLIIIPAIFWITFLLSGILNLNKSFQIEKENSCLEALLLSPVSRGAIFMGKMTGNIIFILVAQLILIPTIGVLFAPSILSHFGELFALTIVAAVGFSALGTLLSGLTSDLRFNEILLPILLFPLLAPMLIACSKITQNIILNQGLLHQLNWLKLLTGFDLIFIVIGYLTFDFVMEM